MHFAAIYSLDHKSSGAAMCAKQGMGNEEERDISDYLSNTESSITVMWMALSKAVKVRKGTIPMAVHPHKCKCAVYVGQGESRLLPHKSNTRSWLSPSLFLSACTRVRGKDGTFWSCGQCMLEPYEQEEALGWAGNTEMETKLLVFSPACVGWSLTNQSAEFPYALLLSCWLQVCIIWDVQNPPFFLTLKPTSNITAFGLVQFLKAYDHNNLISHV